MLNEIPPEDRLSNCSAFYGRQQRHASPLKFGCLVITFPSHNRTFFERPLFLITVLGSTHHSQSELKFYCKSYGLQGWIGTIPLENPWRAEVVSKRFEELSELHQIQVQRCLLLHTKKKILSTSLQTFLDASQDAYRALVYHRIVFENGLSSSVIAADRENKGRAT